MKIINKLFFLSLIFPSLIFSQHQVTNVKANSFQIKINFQDQKYTDKKKGNFFIRDYYESTDPSQPGTYKLPTKEILIAIPPGEKPSVKVISKSEKSYDHIIPKLNPYEELNKDSVIIYKDIDLKNRKTIENVKPVIEIKSCFWWRDFYCADILIRTHSFNENTNTITELKDLALEIRFTKNIVIQNNSPLKLNSSFDEILKNTFYDSEIAEQFRSNPKYIYTDTTGNWINYANTYVKIGTAKDGLVRISRFDLANLGVAVSSINPQTFKLFESGKEQRIFVNGEADGIFDDTDYIEFWGSKNYSKISHHIINSDNQDYNEYLNRYTDTTFYFLTWGNSFGERILITNNFIEGLTDTLSYYTEKLHFEKNVTLQKFNNNDVANEMPNWEKNKTWVSAQSEWINVSSYNFNFQTADVYPDRSCNIYFKLISGGSSIAYNSHNINLSVNGVKIDSQIVNRYAQVLLQGSISSNLLQENNTINIQNFDNGTLPNFLANDWYEVEYPRSIKVINDSLFFRISDDVDQVLRIIKITNVDGNDFLVYKVKPDLKKISNYLIQEHQLLFTDTVMAGDSYVVILQSKIQKPVFYGAKKFVNLRMTNKQADYITITHQKFLNEAQNYISQIANLYSLSTLLINVQDIFDEFGFGYPDPHAIRSYLQYSFDNFQTPKPSYLVLIGDADYDYKKYRFFNDGVIGGGNYVPSYGYPVSDNWFVVWDENSFPIPQLKVGRLPIDNSSELNNYLLKVQNNLNQQYDDWNKRFLFFSGGRANYPEEIKQLKAVNDSIISQLIIPKPISSKYTHFYKTTSPISDFGPYTPEQVSKAIYDGGVFISYIGHSGTATWDNSISEVDQLLNNLNRNPLITDFGCSTNKFAEPDIVCFGERFVLNPNGQALGYVGNSSLGFTSTALTVPNYFYKFILTDSLNQNEISSAHLNAKVKMFNELGGSDVNKIFAFTNTLIGDPAVKIKIPHKPNLNISQSDIILNTSIINEGTDSVLADVIVKNLGKSTGENLLIEYEHYLNSSLIESRKIESILPGYMDTMKIWLNTKNLTGNHTFRIKLDPENKIDEIYEDDNEAQLSFYVFPLNVRDLILNSIENGTVKNLRVLNPVVAQSDSIKIIYQLAKDNQFLDYEQGTIDFQPFSTVIPFSNLQINQRYWFKYRLNQADAQFSQPKSFLNSGEFKFLLNDSISFKSQNKIRTVFQNNNLILSKDSTVISVVSAGWYAGANCVISKNKKNLLSNNFFAGMAIVVFDEKTLEVDTAQWFALFNNPTNMQQLVNLINSIPAGKIVVVGVADDAANNISADLKNAIKTLGSTKIDQLVFRGSWALIGKKEAAPGDVIEEIKGPYDGSVVLDSSFIMQNTEGSVITKIVGPSAKWDEIKILFNRPSDSRIMFYPVGIKKDGTTDTLNIIPVTDTLVNISNIRAVNYPKLKLVTNLISSSDGISPSLNFLSVNYLGVPELGTNYQVVSVSRDSLIQGDSLRLNFDVYNVGESPADSFYVKVDLIKPDNSHRTLMDSLLTKLGSVSKKHYELNYRSNNYDGYGKLIFEISIDPSQRVEEIYKDNNTFQMPFIVKRDTTPTSVTSASLNVTFDGLDIFDGDFISSTPDIQMTLSYPVWFTLSDTNAVQVFLDNEKVNHSQLNIFSDTIKRIIVYKYMPILSDGEHTLRVFGKNITGNLENQPGYEKTFQVAGEMKLVSVYNFPNPFGSSTKFILNMSQIPESIKLRIYTVSGRLIKEIDGIIQSTNKDNNSWVIPWDGRDEDGDLIANGVYLYKVIVKKNGKSESLTQKLTIVK